MSPQEQRIAQLRQIIAETNVGKNPAGQRTLTADLRVKGGLFFGKIRRLTELPDDLTVFGDFMLRGTGLVALPENLKVCGSLCLADTAIDSLPDSLRVYGNLDIRMTRVGDIPAQVCLGSVIRTDQDAENASEALNAEMFLKMTNMPEMPDLLGRLIDFQNRNGFESYCHGFGIYAQDNGVFRAWAKSGALIDSLFCIGQATGSGSVYAIWNTDAAKPLAEQPVVAFGDEGGAWVVASDFSGFLRLLSFDAEPAISAEGIAYEKDQERSERHKQYVAFLKKCGLAAVRKAEELNLMIRQAQGGCQQRLDESLGR
jgi:hypothetical protein